MLSFISLATEAQISICAWNIQNFGKTKNEQEIAFIAHTLKDYDVVAIIEVVAGYGGSQAVARLADALNRKGAKWEYSISHPTTSRTNGTERYAFLWKSAKLKQIRRAWLEEKYQKEIEREPYLIELNHAGKAFTLCAFHAIPANKYPERELRYLRAICDKYPSSNIIFCGDYNCSQENPVFSPIKAIGYQPILRNQKTSLKNRPIGSQYLSSEYDNMFYKPVKSGLITSGVVHFYQSFKTLKQARAISDHLPVFGRFSLN